MKAIGKRSVASFLAGLINVFWYVIAIALVFLLCLAALPLFSDLSNTEMSIPVSFSVDAGLLRVRTPGGGVTTANIRDAQGTIRFPPPSGAFLTITAVLAAVGMAVGLWMLTLLRAVFRSLRDGHPFVAANATRIRWIGYAVILGEIAKSVVVFAGNSYVESHFAADGVRFDTWPSVDVFAIIHGLTVIVIAEVFRAGTRLDEDQSLTI
jgi:Protein of unknown function (DUF2975)